MTFFDPQAPAILDVILFAFPINFQHDEVRPLDATSFTFQANFRYTLDATHFVFPSRCNVSYAVTNFMSLRFVQHRYSFVFWATHWPWKFFCVGKSFPCETETFLTSRRQWALRRVLSVFCVYHFRCSDSALGNSIHGRMLNRRESLLWESPRTRHLRSKPPKVQA